MNNTGPQLCVDTPKFGTVVQETIDKAIREKVEPLREDRQFVEDIEVIASMVSSGVFSEILNSGYVKNAQ